MEGCPYCRNARKAMEELKKENPAYEKLDIDWVEENEQPEISEKYDYFHVPAYFIGQEKLFECSPMQGYAEIRENVKRVFDAALA